MKWENSRLDEICSLVTDGKHGDCQPQEGSGFYFISSKDVSEWKINYEKARQITKDDFLDTHKRTKLEPLDVVITNSGTIGRIAVARDEEKTYQTTFQKSVAIIKPIREKVDPFYLAYALNNLKERLENQSSGTAQKNLLLKDLRRFEVPLPPLPTQKKIASILSAYDDLIENNLKRIRLLEEAAQHLYREWFVRFRFPGWEEVKLVDGLPEGWARKTLGEMCHLTMGQSPSSDFYNEHGEGLPFHQGVTNYGDRFVSHKTYCTNETRIAEEGDILCSVRAPVGRLNITLDKIVIGRGLSAMRNKDKLQSFQFYQLKNHFIQEDMIGGGTIFSSVTKKELENQVFVCPTIELMEEFERVCKPMDGQIRNLHLQNQRLKAARDILLPRLMNQTIEV